MSVTSRSNEFNAGRRGKELLGVCVAWALERRSEAKSCEWVEPRIHKFHSLTMRGDRIVTPTRSATRKRARGKTLPLGKLRNDDHLPQGSKADRSERDILQSASCSLIMNDMT
jgi:hypothetical protein